MKMYKSIKINKDNVKVFINLHAIILFLFRYTRQVLDETLRCSVLAPFAARFQDIDTELGGHVVPKNVST